MGFVACLAHLNKMLSAPCPPLSRNIRHVADPIGTLRVLADALLDCQGTF